LKPGQGIAVTVEIRLLGVGDDAILASVAPGVFDELAQPRLACRRGHRPEGGWMRRACLEVLVIASVFVAACGPGPRESVPAAGATAGVPRLDPAKVPEDLRALVPLAQEWGIGDDVDRSAKGERASPEERARLRAAVAPHSGRITAWLDSFQGNPMSDEAAAFMYLQLAIEELPPP
jgi:hypothetical protein